MMTKVAVSIVDFILGNYDYDEPIFVDELYRALDVNNNTLRQNLKRATDKGIICRYEYKPGIYFIPNPNSRLKKKTLSVNKIINKKYLFNRDRIGYVTGIAFANELGLTTQNPSVLEIVTEAETNPVRVVDYKVRQVALRRPRVRDINEENYRLLQVLDLIKDFEKLSMTPYENAVKSIKNYLGGLKIDKEVLQDYLNEYPIKTKVKILESKLYDEITQR